MNSTPGAPQSTARRSTAEHLRALQEAGVIFSRNRNFDFFTDPGNRKALDLRRRFEKLERLICEAHRDRHLDVTIEAVGAHATGAAPPARAIARAKPAQEQATPTATNDRGSFDIILDLPLYSGRYAARMGWDELCLFLERPEVARVLADLSVQLPEGIHLQRQKEP